MNEQLERIRKSLRDLHPQNRIVTSRLYPGIEFSELTLAAGPVPVQYRMPRPILLIHCCRTGQISWSTENGDRFELNPGDFSLYNLEAGTDAVITVPSGLYEGLSICVDWEEVSAHPPELLDGTGIFRDALREKCRRNGSCRLLAGNEQTEHIFSAFCGQPENLQPAYRRLKVLELLLYLAGLDGTPCRQAAEYPSEQAGLVREIHDWLTGHMEQRITIEELSRQYPINPTTLKTAFKAVYGSSIAAHMKEHRMELAARLLRESDLTIAEIAQEVGYDSQSKFTAAFKAVFHLLPKEYRKGAG